MALHIHEKETGGKLPFTPGFYAGCLDMLGDRSHPAALVLSDNGQIRYCNAAAAALLGSAPQDVAGRHLRSLIPQLPLNSGSPGGNVA